MTIKQRSSHTFRHADEIEQAWSEQFQMDISLSDRHHCFFRTQQHQLPGIGLTLFSGSRSAMTRSWAQAANASQDLVLCIAFAANVRVSRSGIEKVYLPGQAHVWIADQSTDCEVDGDYSAIMLNIPTSQLSGVDIDYILDRGIVNADGELKLLVSYARGTAHAWDSLNDLTTARAADHLRELATMALVAGGSNATNEQRQSMRATRLSRIKADIQYHLNNPGLSPTWIASREGISNRYLRDLLADEQTNFSQLVMDMRLEQSYQQLRDPRYRHRPISAIAFGCGFGDLSYFCRVFKRRFAATPTEIRLLGRSS